MACVDFPPPMSSGNPEGFDGPEEGCPEAWETCITFEAQGRLNRYLAALKTWADQAWIGCQPEDYDDTTDHDPDHAPTPGAPRPGDSPD